MKEKIESKIKGACVENSCAVKIKSKDNESSGECDLVFIRKSRNKKRFGDYTKYGIFEKKVEAIIELETELPAGKKFKKFKSKIKDKIKFADIVVLMVEKIPKNCNLAAKGTKSFNKKMDELVQATSGKIKYYSFSNDGLNSLITDLKKLK